MTCQAKKLENILVTSEKEERAAMNMLTRITRLLQSQHRLETYDRNDVQYENNIQPDRKTAAMTI